jgi:hypothetical protein
VTAKQGAPPHTDADYTTRRPTLFDLRTPRVAELTTMAPTAAADAHSERPNARSTQPEVTARVPEFGASRIIT